MEATVAAKTGVVMEWMHLFLNQKEHIHKVVMIASIVDIFLAKMGIMMGAHYKIIMLLIDSIEMNIKIMHFVGFRNLFDQLDYSPSSPQEWAR
jgi:hypothetical protein